MVTRSPLPFLLGALLALGGGSGCSSSDAAAADPGTGDEGEVPGGGQTGEENLGCRAVDVQALGRSDRSALGFSADELFAALGVKRNLPLTWADGAGTSLELGFDAAASVIEFQDREFMSDSSGAEPALGRPEIAMDCPDVIAIALELRFVTADGRFDELWPVELTADTVNTARVYYQPDLSALNGSFELLDFQPSAFESASLGLALNLVGAIWTGSLDGQGTSSASGGPDSAVSGTDFPVATF